MSAHKSFVVITGILILLSFILIDLPSIAFNPNLNPATYEFRVFFVCDEGRLNYFHFTLDIDQEESVLTFNPRCPNIPKHFEIRVPGNLTLDEYTFNVVSPEPDSRLIKGKDFQFKDLMGSRGVSESAYLFSDFKEPIDGWFKFIFKGKIIPNGRFAVYANRRTYSGSGTLSWFEGERILIKLGKNYKLIGANNILNSEIRVLNFEDGDRVYVLNQNETETVFSVGSYDVKKLRLQTVSSWFLYTLLGVFFMALWKIH